LGVITLRKNMRIFKIISLLAIIVSGFSYAEITPGPQAKSKGDLGLVIVASDSPKYIKEWVSTPSEHGVTIRRLKRAKPNQLIVSSFLVTGLSADVQGNYSFSVSFYLLGPNGKAVFGQSDYGKGSGKLPDKPVLIMADPALDIVLEQSDPPGEYSIAAKVKDLVNGNVATDTYTIELVK
jgi:hypothetical protein